MLLFPKKEKFVMKEGKFQIRSKRQAAALEYALDQLHRSDIAPYIEKVYLYGSCAKGEENWDSDVDIFIQLSETCRDHPEIKKCMILLKGSASTDNIEEPEADLKFVVGPEWRRNSMLYYKNVKKDGVEVWP